MKVKVLYDFNDLTENVKRTTGEEFECSKERAEFLISRKAVEEVVEEVKEEKEVVEKQVEVLKEARKRKSKKEEE